MLVTNVKAMNEAERPVQSLRLDVTDHDAFKRILDETIAKQGMLDYIFNNAGIAIAGDLRDVSIDDWRKVLDVNRSGVIYGLLRIKCW